MSLPHELPHDLPVDVTTTGKIGVSSPATSASPTGLTDVAWADLPFSPAAERNQGPILAELSACIGPLASVLELASGTGQHAVHFAAAMPGWRWQPSDRQADGLGAVAARCAGFANVAVPVVLDLLDESTWPAAVGPGFDALYVANLLHIAPWPVCAALMRLASTRVREGGQLIVYGPFVIDTGPDAQPTAPSNLDFDADLRGRDPAWGLRRLADVQQAAAVAGLVWCRRVAMPANNELLRWQRRG